MNKAQKIELLQLLEEKERRAKLNAIASVFSSLYDWQIKFIDYTAEYRAACLMAANRVGKTYTGCLIDAIHATGDYPEDYNGHRFEHPPLIWVLGYSGEKIRD
ncbi:MAG: DNA packaging protein, partial [Alphaproteobacteria bacterium]|nr:DNA packaging protein [Alphaproteobacteria bacterium]